MWSEDIVKNLPPEAKRYVLMEGRLEHAPKATYKMTRMISSTDNFDTARNRAVRLCKQGTNVVILDTKMGALIGNMWMISKELERVV
jgi:hypothetical protein